MINDETIDFKEFRAWLTGLIVGKRGALPDLDDWKQIKIMIDKVEEREPTPTLQPLQPAPMMRQPYWGPYTDPQQPQWVPNNPIYPDYPSHPGYGTWCGDTQTIKMGGCYGDTAGTFADKTMTYSMTNSVDSDTIQLDLDLGNVDVVTSGFVQVAVAEESKKLGEELQKMIEENENGQKESS